MGDNSVNKRSLAISLCQGAGGSQSLVYNCAADCTCTLQCQHGVQCTSRYDIAATPICNIEQFFSIVIIGKILWEYLFDKLPRYLDIDKRLHQYFLRRATTYGNIFLSLSLSFCTLVGLFNELNLTKHVSKSLLFLDLAVALLATVSFSQVCVYNV